jgi:hypothetical protein
MKIQKVKKNNRKKQFEITTHKGVYVFPYAKAKIGSTSSEKVVEAFVDSELGNEAFTYVLQSGKEGTLHIDAILDFNRDPDHLNKLRLYYLSLLAKKKFEQKELGVRSVANRLKTSPSQLYRLLDPSNYSKSIDQMFKLLDLLECNIDLRVDEEKILATAQ